MGVASTIDDVHEPRVHAGPRVTSRVRQASAAALVTTAVSVIATWLAFRPMGTWLSYPLAYTESSDGLVNLWVARTVRDAAWFGVNPRLGAPFGATSLDFARPEWLFLGFYKALAPVTSSAVLEHNLLYLAGFTLVAWAALPVFRGNVGLSWPLAVAGSLVFAWLPYHFNRIEHLFLSVYIAVPAAASLLLRLTSDRPPFFERGRLGFGTFTGWLAIVVTSWTSAYYAFFALVLIASEGLLASIRLRAWRPCASAALVTVAIAATVTIAVSPTLIYRATAGPNPLAFVRAPAEGDAFALRPLRLLLPDPAHRIDAFARPALAYGASRADGRETQWSALGLIGSAGLLLLLAHLLTGGRVLPRGETMAALARAATVSLALGVVGGAGALVALALTPQFRALNRLSVFIGFFAIAACLAAADRVMDRAGRRRTAAAVSVAACLLVIAFLDQRPVRSPERERIVRAFDDDEAFVGEVERTLHGGAAVFQEPHTPFPEEPPRRKEPSYSPLRMYLHSDRLRWSYGSIKGRREDDWLQAVDLLPADERVAVLQSSGFAAVVVDRLALPERGAAAERALVAAGARPGAVSRDGGLSLFTLPASDPASDRASLVIAPASGFYEQEGTPPQFWRWTRGNAEAWVHRFGTVPLRVTLSCALRSLVPRRVSIRAADEALGSVAIAGAGVTVAFERTFELKPGWTKIRFETDQPAVSPGPPDTRALAVYVETLRLRPVH